MSLHLIGSWINKNILFLTHGKFKSGALTFSGTSIVPFLGLASDHTHCLWGGPHVTRGCFHRHLQLLVSSDAHVAIPYATADTREVIWGAEHMAVKSYSCEAGMSSC